MKKILSIFLAALLFGASSVVMADSGSGYLLADYLYDEVIASEDGSLFAYIETGNGNEKTVYVFDENGSGNIGGKF